MCACLFVSVIMNRQRKRISEYTVLGVLCTLNKSNSICKLNISGDLSNVVTAVLEVPRRHAEEKINYKLKWVLW